MSRIVGRPRAKENFGTGMKLSEMIVFVLVVVAVIAGVRYYFVVYRNSPGYALSRYLGGVKTGNVPDQYEMLDAEDKARFPTKKEYDKQNPQARGYTARIADFKLEEPKLDPKKPHLAVIDVTIKIRGRSSGQELYQQNEQGFKDQFTLRKDKTGQWKVWLPRWKRGLLQAEPSPAGDPIGSD